MARTHRVVEALPAPEKKPHGLTYLERRFAERYVSTGKIEESATWAGYAPSSAKNAGAILAKPHVLAFVKIRMDQAFARERMSNDEILAMAARIVRMDPRDFFDEFGKIRPVSELTREQAYGLRGFQSKVEDFGEGEDARHVETSTLKLADPLPALVLLAKVNKLTSNDHAKLNVFLNLDARMDRARKRAARSAAGDGTTDVDSRVVSEQ